VVDDSIVVLENIYRNIEHGMPRVEAALKGTKEIGFAVIAMTLTLVAVFAPLAFSTGRTGRLSSSSRSHLPVRCWSRFCRADAVADDVQQVAVASDASRRLYNLIDAFLDGMTKGYARSLAWVLSHRWLVLMVWALVVAVGG